MGKKCCRSFHQSLSKDVAAVLRLEAEFHFTRKETCVTSWAAGIICKVLVRLTAHTCVTWPSCKKNCAASWMRSGQILTWCAADMNTWSVPRLVIRLRNKPIRPGEMGPRAWLCMWQVQHWQACTFYWAALMQDILWHGNMGRAARMMTQRWGHSVLFHLLTSEGGMEGDLLWCMPTHLCALCRFCAHLLERVWPHQIHVNLEVFQVHLQGVS